MTGWRRGLGRFASDRASALGLVLLLLLVLSAVFAPILAVRIVDDLEAACAHIRTYGSGHTEAIVTTDAAAAERFAVRVDSAIVIWNASTQFADGGEFGFGAEIGISTQKLHARGPMGLAEMTSTKYVIEGDGQVRA